MEKIIKQKLNELERTHNFKIIFAVETGSRSYNIQNLDSDYDVRFVYVRPIEEYITIKEKDDIIHAKYDSIGNRCSDNAVIDIVGFDIKKFSVLLSKSNPSIIEWLQSNIVYKGKKPTIWYYYATTYFDPKALFYHYKSMAKSNYMKYIEGKKIVEIKKYLYVLRSLINAKIVANRNCLPSINFVETLNCEKTLKLIDRKIIDKTYELVLLKKLAIQKTMVEDVMLNNYIIDFLDKEDTVASFYYEQTDSILDQELKRLVFKKVKR